MGPKRRRSRSRARFSSDLPRAELQRIADVCESSQWLRARVLDLAHWATDPGVPKIEQDDAAMEMCRICRAHPEMLAGSEDGGMLPDQK